MFISYEGRIEKNLYIIMEIFSDDSSSIIGICDNEYETTNKLNWFRAINNGNYYFAFKLNLIDEIASVYEDLAKNMF